MSGGGAQQRAQRLADAAPDLELALTCGGNVPVCFARSEVHRSTVWVIMRDGVKLATEIYMPGDSPAPAIAMRTPYGRTMFNETMISIAQSGYVVISQDCRGTGDSEPDTWEYYVYEREDSFDFVEWVSKQHWFNGFLGACGASYLAQTQWCMSLNPRMSTIVPEVGGLGIAFHTARHYMFFDAYARSVGKGADKVAVSYQELERQMFDETLAGGYFNEPLSNVFSDAILERYPLLRALQRSEGRRWLWEHYCVLPPSGRAELIKDALGVQTVTTVGIEALSSVFGYQIAHDAHIFACERPSTLCRSLHAPALMITGWYDWGLNDTLATWGLLAREARWIVASRSRLVIAPSAHNKPGYHEGEDRYPELQRNYRTPNIIDLLLKWYAAVQVGTVDSWPTVVYYLMGANEWWTATNWPPSDGRTVRLYLGAGGRLAAEPAPPGASPEFYTYNPNDPTPTLGGSIVSYVVRPGSVDVSEVQRRSDVLSFTTEMLTSDLDVVGELKLVLYASSSAVDTDFAARLSDVFPDGRAIQLQSGLLRARHRDLSLEPEALVPGQVYRFEIDMWATANRFKAGHRLRIDISSADFPKFDRNANTGGSDEGPVSAMQTIYHDRDRPSHLTLSILGRNAVLSATHQMF